MAEVEETLQEDGGGSSPVKWILLAVVGALLLVVMTVAGMFFMLKATGMLNGAGGQPAAAAKAVREPIYHPLDPPFVVNINDNGRMRFLQVKMEVMAREPKAIEQVEKHMPLIRNRLVLLLSSQSVKELSSPDGKEYLRDKALREVQGVLKEETGEEGIEAVYITSLIIQ